MSDDGFTGGRKRKFKRKGKGTVKGKPSLKPGQAYTHVDLGFTSRGRKRVLVPLENSDEVEVGNTNAGFLDNDYTQSDDQWIDDAADWQHETIEASGHQKSGKVNLIILDVVNGHADILQTEST